MTGRPQKRSLTIKGHRTSISLEDEFWQALHEIAGEEGKSLTGLVTEIDQARIAHSLSSAIRLYVLDVFRKRAKSRNVRAPS